MTLTVEPGSVVVRDAGPGPGADLPTAAGERFRPGSPNGTGLGLAIARWVADLHDGSLTLRPAEGGGTEATLTLPTPDTPKITLILRELLLFCPFCACRTHSPRKINAILVRRGWWGGAGADGGDGVPVAVEAVAVGVAGHAVAGVAVKGPAGEG
ncbi:sensor histidine kinase [Catellatospora coxensis]